MRRITPEGTLASFGPEVGRLWRTRDVEPPDEDLPYPPPWLNVDTPDPALKIGLKETVALMMATLTWRERVALHCRFWLDYTYEDAAQAMCLTRERVRQIEARALRKLRHPTRASLLRDYVDFRCEWEIPRWQFERHQSMEGLKKAMDKIILENPSTESVYRSLWLYLSKQ